MGQEADEDPAEAAAAAWRARDEHFNRMAGSWAGAIAALLVMGPSVYRLIDGPVLWFDVVAVLVGTGLVGFHVVRLVRLRRGTS